MKRFRLDLADENKSGYAQEQENENKEEAIKDYQYWYECKYGEKLRDDEIWVEEVS